jgi:hypothetical protein
MMVNFKEYHNDQWFNHLGVFSRTITGPVKVTICNLTFDIEIEYKFDEILKTGGSLCVVNQPHKLIFSHSIDPEISYGATSLVSSMVNTGLEVDGNALWVSYEIRPLKTSGNSATKVDIDFWYLEE